MRKPTTSKAPSSARVRRTATERFHSPVSGWQDHWDDVVRVIWAAGLSAKGAQRPSLNTRIRAVLHDAVLLAYTAAIPERKHLRRLRRFVTAAAVPDTREEPSWKGCFDPTEFDHRDRQPSHGMFDAATTFLGHELFLFATEPSERPDVRLAASVACGLTAVFDPNGQSLALLHGVAQVVPRDDTTELQHAFLRSIAAGEYQDDGPRLLSDARRLLARAERLRADLAEHGPRHKGGRPRVSDSQVEKVIRALKRAAPRKLYLDQLRTMTDLRGIRDLARVLARAEEREQGHVSSEEDAEHRVLYGWH